MLIIHSRTKGVFSLAGLVGRVAFSLQIPHPLGEKNTQKDRDVNKGTVKWSSIDLVKFQSAGSFEFLDFPQSARYWCHSNACLTASSEGKSTVVYF